MIDRNKRMIDYLRISVTDRCNLRCVYCMPETGIKNLPHKEILTYKEILQIVRAAAQLGIRKIKITGGEPLIRRGIVNLIGMIRCVSGIEEVTMTTNGVLLGEMAGELVKAGLASVNISLDSNNPFTFSKITRRDNFLKVSNGIEMSVHAGLRTKINCVPIADLNSGVIVEIAEIAKRLPVDVRFIELMPIGLGSLFTPIGTENIFRQLENEFGPLKPSTKIHGNGPAKYYELDGFCGSVGFISALSHEFCRDCNRIRLTADGNLKLCLHYDYGIALKPLIRGGINQERLKMVIGNAIFEKPDHHSFKEGTAFNIESKRMVQIGG